MAIAGAVLQRDAPDPARRVCAVERVYGVKSALRSQGTAQARSQGSQCVQSSQGTAELVAQQQRAEAAAVDEEVACDRLRRT